MTFTIRNPASAPATSTLPATGFAPNRVTTLASQPADKAYSGLGDFWLEIPRLGMRMNIVGVPENGNSWDVSWLGNQAGWLNGTAYPTTAGNSVLTGHVYLANGKPGPFVAINTLWWGDLIIVHAGAVQYTYAVRSIAQVSPDSVSSAFKHESLPWITLMTCRGYDEASNSYQYRVLVGAVLVSVK
jgi:LPXTG-site transpeptidase (sortase) family protein